MALYDDPPHAVSVYTSAASRDAGGGTQLAFTLVQSGVACSINTASASTVDLFAQQQIKVTHTVAFLRTALTATLAPGMKLVSTDNGYSLHVEGISLGRAYGGIPAFTYAHCSELE